MGLAFFALFAGVSVVLIPLMILLGSISPVLVLPLVVTLLASYLALTLAAAALKGIYQAAQCFDLGHDGG